ncbi:MAG TPA: hypothetical protein PLF90_04480 [bacterium]|nr:hypothetical protein [bacterium]
MEKAMMFLSFFLGFLSVVVAIVLPIVLGRRTDELIRTEDERAKSLISETQKMIERMNIAHREMLERMDDTLRFLGTLIKSEGEKTRELINKVLEKMP